MADTKISGLTTLSLIAAEDLFLVVDVSDTTMGEGGSNKRVTLARLTADVLAGAGLTANRALVTSATGAIAAATTTAAELGYLAGLTPGYGQANKALVTDANMRVRAKVSIPIENVEGGESISPTDLPETVFTELRPIDADYSYFQTNSMGMQIVYNTTDFTATIMHSATLVGLVPPKSVALLVYDTDTATNKMIALGSWT